MVGFYKLLCFDIDQCSSSEEYKQSEPHQQSNCLKLLFTEEGGRRSEKKARKKDRSYHYNILCTRNHVVQLYLVYNMVAGLLLRSDLLNFKLEFPHLHNIMMYTMHLLLNRLMNYDYDSRTD